MRIGQLINAVSIVCLLGACSPAPVRTPGGGAAPPPSSGAGGDRAAPGAGKPSAGPNAGRYAIAQDGLPTADSIPADVFDTPDAIPRPEPLALRGNPDSYEVLGRSYNVLSSNRGFRQRGDASWYGRKFQGYTTSSGEIYDMFEMTAAHKTLPLPSYVQVTNLANGRKVVVRVNDRGPFHDGRVIDLSYAAAARLGVLQNGTAPVEIVTLEGGAPPATEQSAPPLYLQVGAYGSSAAAERVVAHIRSLGLNEVFVTATDSREPLYRVRLGPYTGNDMARNARSRLEANGYRPSALRY